MDQDTGRREIGTRQVLAIGAAVLGIAGLVTLASMGGPKTGSARAAATRSTAGSLPDGGVASGSASTSVSGATTGTDRSSVPGQAGGGSPTALGSSRAGQPASSAAAGVPVGPLLPVGQGVHGVTDKVIKVGIPTMDYAAVAHAGFAPSGGSNSNIDDSFAVKAATDWVNTHGGIAGRRVEVTEYRVNVNSEVTASGRQQEDAAACSSFTQDHHVFAMSGDNMTEDNYLECAKQNKTPAVFSSIGNVAPSYSRLASMQDYWYAPTGLVADRRERAMAKFVVQRKFLRPGDTFALITQDLPSIREAVDTQMKPVLKAEGFTPAAEVRYTEGLSNDWSAAILQFQQHVPPVTKIVFSATTQDMFAPFTFMRAAESQNYRPDYALGTDEHPNQLTLGTSTNQLRHVFGMGWMPWSDLGDTADMTPSTHQCGLAMMAEGISAAPPNYASCEFLFFLQQAFKHASEVSPAGLAAGVAKMGGSYPAVFARHTLYGPDKHDGAVEVREVRYSVDPQACGGSSACLHYTTGALPVPN
ncbi:MAG: ABC transporter substrate-binding protein [Acidimicrobiales bacterium]